jgi:hypothetical protein
VVPLSPAGRTRLPRAEARLLPSWALNCGALLAQLPLAWRLQPVLGGSYLLATGAAPVILMLARFTVCERWLYRAGRQCAPPDHDPARFDQVTVKTPAGVHRVPARAGGFDYLVKRR